MEVFLRARAWFVTMAFCSIENTNFLDLQNAIFASDKIMQKALQTSGGQYPPIGFLAGAWAQTIQYFSEQVRISGKPLTEFIQHWRLGTQMELDQRRQEKQQRPE